jgi:hypothetical protein
MAEYLTINLLLTNSEWFECKRKLQIRQYYNIFKYPDIVVCIKTHTPETVSYHYSDITGILSSLCSTTQVYVSFDCIGEKYIQILNLIELFTLNRSTEKIQ